MNKPFIVSIVFAMLLPFWHQQFQKSKEREERIARLDIQISNALYKFQNQIQSSKSCEDLSKAIYRIIHPDPLYPEFKDMPLEGLILDLRKNLKSNGEQHKLYQPYQATSSLATLYEHITMNKCNVQSTKEILRKKLEGPFKERHWFNIPQFYSH